MGTSKNKTSSDNFRDRVLAVLRCIPKGKVLTYGQVATLAGVPRAARIVGGILFSLGPGHRLPWQRVINAKGALSTYRVGFGEQQKVLLEEEGLCFDAQRRVDVKRYQWVPGERMLKKLGVDKDLPAQLLIRAL